MKKNPVKILIQVLFPVLLISALFIIISPNKKLVPQTNYNQFEVLLDSNDSLSQKFYLNSTLGILSENQENLNSMIEYLKEYCNISKIINFSDYGTFENFYKNSQLEGSNYGIRISGKNDDLSFQIYINKSFTNVLIETSLLSDQRLENHIVIQNIQMMITNYLVFLKGEKPNYHIKSIPAPTPPIYIGNITNLISGLIIEFIVGISFLSLFFMLVLTIIKEKQNKLTFLLFRQGVTYIEYSLSWILTYILLMIISLFLIALEINRLYLINTPYFTIFFSLLIFNLNIPVIALFFQTVARDIATAQTLIKIFYLCITLISAPVNLPSTPIYLKIILLIFPQVSFANTFRVLEITDSLGGMQLNFLNEGFDGLSYLVSIIAMVANIFIFGGLSLFIHNFDRLKILFRTKKISGNTPHSQSVNLIINDDENDFKTISEDIVSIELKQQELNNECIKIKSVVKSHGDFKAVKGISLNLYKNQIFVLLGHNGAGKSTLINTISGVYKADSGEVLFDGRNVLEDKQYLLENMGVCYQDDIYFDYLTVIEHLKLMQELRSKINDPEEIEEILEKLELKEKANSLGKELSGGQKRKLCIGLAVIGSSKFIMLDEPTSGLDVTAQRFLWDFLKKFKKDKIILLTTHSLDEADFLADRVGIVSSGRLVCCGSSSFLKNQYSCGFTINFLFNTDSLNGKKVPFQGFLKEIRKVDSTAKLKSFSKTTLHINFPSVKYKSEVLQTIFKIKDKFGIISYTISTTSLEDVFLKLNEHENTKNLFEDMLMNDENEHELQVKDDTNFVTIVTKRTCKFSNDIWVTLRRLVISIFRNKLINIFELVASLFPFLIFILIYKVLDLATTSLTLHSFLTQSPIQISIDKNFDDRLKFDFFKKVFPDANFYESKFDSQGVMNFENFTYENNPNHLTLGAINFNNNDNIFTSIQLYHRSTVFALNNVIFRTYLKINHNISSPLVSSIETFPLNETIIGKNILYILAPLLLVTMLTVCLINMTAYSLQQPLKERLNNVKHLQYLYGINNVGYWIGIFLTDLIRLIIFYSIVFPIAVANSSFFVENIGIIILYTFSCFIYCYINMYFIDKEEDGQKFYIIVTFGLIILFGVLTFIFIFEVDPKSFHLTFIDFLPTSALLYRSFLILRYGTQLVKINAYFVFVLDILIYLIILYLLDSNLLGKLVKQCVNLKNHKVDPNPNKYIEAEKNKVETPNKLTFEIKNLTKIYKSLWCGSKDMVAVKQLNLGLEENEKFGLLGINGSGKSTTFKIITNEIVYNEGKIFFNKTNLSKEFETFRSSVGYCPQTNPIFDFLTVEETFHYYLDLKMKNKHKNVLTLMEDYGLLSFRNTKAKNLSGGNKRKLCFAIALMNHPKLILLDEPSAGVDPESRRVMWKQINLIPKFTEKFNMILTTHSLEEGELLCDTLGWMKQGNFLCVGNPERLKKEFSDGYIVQIKLKKDNSNEISDFNEPEFKKLVLSLNCGFDIEKIFEKEKVNEVRNYLKNIYFFLLKIRGEIDSVKFLSRFENHFEFLISFRDEYTHIIFDLLLGLKEQNQDVLEINIEIQDLEKIFKKLNDEPGN